MSSKKQVLEVLRDTLLRVFPRQGPGVLIPAALPDPGQWEQIARELARACEQCVLLLHKRLEVPNSDAKVGQHHIAVRCRLPDNAASVLGAKYAHLSITYSCFGWRVTGSRLDNEE